MTRGSAHFTFGRGSAGANLLGEGWSHVEPDFNWTEGPSSTLTLPVPEGPGNLQIELFLNPILMDPVVRHQQLILSSGGETLADEMVSGETAIGVEIDEAKLAGRDSVELRLDCPATLVPADLGMNLDERSLAFALSEVLLLRVPARPPFSPRALPPLTTGPGGLDEAVRFLTGLSVQDVAAAFESIGHNCEFGLAQRKMGIEPLGLLRFAGLPLHKLLEGLDLEFAGIDAPGNLMTFEQQVGPQREFMVRDQRYGAVLHSHLYAPASTAAEVLKIFYRNLAFLRRKFVEDLQAGEKIFVFQHPGARSLAQIRPILTLLRSHGPNTLLWITDDRARPSGTVEQLDTDLMHGYVDKLAPTNDVPLLELPPWIMVCANAYRLWRLSGRGS